MFTQRLTQWILLLCIVVSCAVAVNAQQVASPVQTASERVEHKLSSAVFLGISVDRDDEAVFHMAPFYDHVEAVRGIELVGGLNFVNSDVNGVQVAGILNLVGGELLGVQVSGGANWVGGEASFAQVSGVLTYVGEDFAGVQVSGGANWVGGEASFAQVSGVLTYVGEDFAGVQVSGGANWVGGEASFAQVSGVLTYVGEDFTGVQVSGGANWVGGEASFAQVSGVFNYVGGGFAGVQISGGLNWVSEDASFLQVAGLANVSLGTFSGLQVSVANIANDVNGVQIGVVNLAANVSGTQIGLVNISDRIEGFPIGLFNYARQGSLHVMLWSSTAIPFQVGVKSAFNELSYSLLSLGLTDTSRVAADVLTAACGMGVHIPVAGRLYLDADASMRWSPVFESSLGCHMQLQGRMVLGFKLTDELSVFIGAVKGVPIWAARESADTMDTVFFGCQLF
jgi:hypothetical protein